MFVGKLFERQRVFADISAEAHVTWVPTMRTDEVCLSDWLNIGTTENQDQSQGRRVSARQPTYF
jgi:hypothetical protein